MSAFDENPFADPSVQRATAGSGQAAAVLDNYDPFSKDKSEPAVMAPTLDTPAAAPPPYTASAQQTASQADFLRRQEELERKAAELARREAELNSAPFNARVNNWPPIPSFIPLQPCFYQDINVDIPVEFQEMVRRLYYLWLLHAALLLGNLFGGVCFLFGGLDNGSMFGLSLVYCFFFIPLSFICWFRPAYKAFRSDSSFNFMVFFFIFFCQFCFSVVMALGIPQTGGAGLITAIVTFRGGTRSEGPAGGDYFVGFIILCIAFGFSAAALADFFMLTKIHGYYRATGASLTKAQAEFTSSVLSNEQVRQAAAQAAVAGVRNNFQGQGGSSVRQ